MENVKISSIVKDKKVRFSHYRAGYLYYDIYFEGELYMFPVQIEDIGDATFMNEDKAILFTRYIRKALDDKTFVKH